MEALRKANNCRPFLQPLPSHLAHLARSSSSALGSGPGHVDYEYALSLVQARVSPEGAGYRGVRALLRDLEDLARQCEVECTRDQRRTVSIAQELFADAQSIAGLLFPSMAASFSSSTSTSNAATNTVSTDQEEQEVTEDGEGGSLEVSAPSEPPTRLNEPEVATPTIVAAATPMGLFTVVLRADGHGAPFVVPLERYQQCVTSLQGMLPAAYPSSAPTKRRSSGSSTGAGDQTKLTLYRSMVACRGAKGVVVGLGSGVPLGSDSSTGSSMGWDHIEVDWMEPLDCPLPSRINAWELDIA